MQDTDTTKIKIDPLVERLVLEKTADYNFQARRHPQWNTNYELYRDRVQINRLTQRQAINYPLMKETLRSIMSNIDDFPGIHFNILERGEPAEKKELILNEIWVYHADIGSFEIKDSLEKKVELLTGRGFKKLNFMDRKFELDILDTFDVLVDPKVKPWDLETARHIEHIHIFKPLREIMADKKYLAKGKSELKVFMSSGEGLVQSDKNKEELEAKRKRMEAMGVDSFDEFEAGDVIVELNEHFTYLWDKEKEKFVRYVMVVANEHSILFKKPLKDALGIEEYPFETWASDLDVSDFWSDGNADVIRGLNKILNVWLSQLLENRTYRNYGMQFFDSTNPEFVPQEFTPKPFGMYPVPGDPNKILKQVDTKDMSESLDEMAFLITAAEKATGATKTEKGVGEKNKTLGEIEILLAKSQEITGGSSKFYNKSWKRTAEKFFKIINANVSYADVVTLYKESISGKMYSFRAGPKDWKTEAGYKVKVIERDKKKRQDIEELQKIMLIQARFPYNPKIQKWAERKMLELTGTPPEEVDALVDVKDQERMPVGAPEVTPQAPVVPTA